MSTVKVWNDSHNDYVEQFKGREVMIKSQGYVEMPRGEAITFLGTFRAPRADSIGRSLNEKRLRIEFDHEAEAKRKDQPVKFVCELTKQEFRTEAGWQAHLKTMEATHKIRGGTDGRKTRSKSTG